MITDEMLDSRLEDLARSRAPLPHASELDELFESSLSRHRTRRRRKFIRNFGIFGLLLAASAVAVPVAADQIHEFLAQNVSPATSFGGGGVPGSEYVDTSQPDINEYIASLYPADLRLPDGYTKDDVIAKVNGFNLHPIEGITQEVVFQRQYEQVAYCGWVTQWLDADSSGDVAGRDDVAQVLLEAASWPAFTATDGNAEGSNSMSLTDFFRMVGKGAIAGDRTAVEQTNDLNHCSAWKVAK